LSFISLPPYYMPLVLLPLSTKGTVVTSGGLLNLSGVGVTADTVPSLITCPSGIFCLPPSSSLWNSQFPL